MFLKVFGYLEHTNNYYIFFPYRGQNDRNETKLTCNRGFRWITGSNSNDSICRPGVTADMDPPSQIGPPYQTFLLSIVCIILSHLFYLEPFFFTTQHSSVKVKKNSHFAPILPHVL